MFLVDTEPAASSSDEEIKSALAARAALRRVAARRPHPPRRPARARAHRAHRGLGRPPPADLRLHRGGAAHPPRRRWPAPAPSRSARWAPTPRSPCSRDRPRLLFDYFSQLFAQVTNPPLDAIREELVTSLGAALGPEGNLLDATPAHAPPGRPAVPGHRQRRARQDRAHQRRRRPAGLRTRVVQRPLRRHRRRGRAARRGSRRSSREVSAAIAGGARFVVLSDRDSDRDLAPIPSLLLTAAVHHHLIREKTRTQVGLLVEAGDVREVHHVALLIGYGAAAVNPYLAMETVEDLVRSGAITEVTEREGRRATSSRRSARACSRSCRKMGISTVALLPRRPGLRGHRPVAGPRRRATSPAPSRQLGGVGLDVLARRDRGRGTPGLPARRHPSRRTACSRSAASTSGAARASRTCSTPRRSSASSTRPGPRRYDVFKQYTRRVDDQSGAPDDPARALRARGGEPAPARADRRGRAGQRDRQAVQHRRDELRLDLARRRTRRSRSR